MTTRDYIRTVPRDSVSNSRTSPRPVLPVGRSMPRIQVSREFVARDAQQLGLVEHESVSDLTTCSLELVEGDLRVAGCSVSLMVPTIQRHKTGSAGSRVYDTLKHMKASVKNTSYSRLLPGWLVDVFVKHPDYVPDAFAMHRLHSDPLRMFFWGTIYQATNRVRCVRYIWRDPEENTIKANFRPLTGNFRKTSPAIVFEL